MRIHIIIEEENQYSVLLLNCYPTAVTVSVGVFFSVYDQGHIQIRNRYNGMLVNLSVEEQLEVLIWPTVFVFYLFIFVVFLVINSKARFRGTPFLRHVDIVLEVIVFIKILSSFFQSCIILYTLHYNTVNILRSASPRSFTPHPFVTYLNSLFFRLVDASLLMLFFLLACGWQITHQLLTVVR